MLVHILHMPARPSIHKRLAIKWAQQDAISQVVSAAAPQPSPACASRTFEDELSALCEQLFTETGGMAPMVPVLPEQPPVSGTPTGLAKNACLSKGEAAALDILSLFDQKQEEVDDFGDGPSIMEKPERDPSMADISSLRDTSMRETKIWRSATEIEKVREQKYRSPMQKLLDVERHHRGCARGACCVYSMWYDPAWGGHGNCTHKCTISHGAFARCGPSLFALGLPPLDRPGELRRDNDRIRWIPPTNLVRPSKRRRRIHPQCDQKNHSEGEIALPFDATSHHDHHTAISSVNKAHRECQPKRTRKHLSTVSRVRKSLGRRTFGKLSNSKKVFRQLSRSLEETHKRL
jgi:hypothetical protein